MSTYRCGACGAMNRLGRVPEGKAPVCGRCKERLDRTGKPQAVDGAALARAIKSAPVPVLVDFWATWCGPCRLAAPILERVAGRLAGEIIVLKVDNDAEPAAAREHGISSLPTFAMFARGREIARQSGLLPEAAFASWIEQHLARAA